MDQLSFNNINDGIFDRVYINYNGTLQNIVDLIGGGGGGGSIISAVSPLNLTNNVLTLGAFPSSGINILDSNSTNHIISVNTSSQLLLDGNVISGGGGGTVTSATAPLSINNGVLSIDLSSYFTTSQINSMLTNYVTSTQHTTDLATKIDTSHEANNLGNSNVTHLYDFKTETLTLQNAQGISTTLSVGLSGLVSIGSDGIVTIPYLSSWSPNQLRISDSNNVSRLLTAATNGNLLWNNNILAFTSSLAGYEPLITLTTDRALISNGLGKVAASQVTSTELSYLSGTTQNIVTSLAAKQNTLTAGTGITLTNNILESTFRPSRCSAGSGIVLLQSDANGTLSISANGQQTNQYLRLADTNGITYDITADTNGNLLLGSDIITTNPYLVTVLQAYATTASLNNALTNYTTTANLTTLLNAKQDSLTAGTGITLSSNTLEATFRPSRCVAGSNITLTADDIAGTLTIASSGGGSSLTGLSTSGSGATASLNYNGSEIRVNSHSVSSSTGAFVLEYATNKQSVILADTNQFSALLDGTQDFRVYDTSSNIGFQVDGTGGCIIRNDDTPGTLRIQSSNNATAWAAISFLTDTGAETGRFFAEGSGSGGNMRYLSNGNYMTFQNSTNQLFMNGSSLNWNGSFSATSKSFVINHPNPNKVPDTGKVWKLKHHNIESDKPYLMYRTRINMTSTTQTFQMSESWYPHLAKDSYVNVSPYKHFGCAWGDIESDGFTFTIHSNQTGEYNVLITAVRNDACGVDCLNEPIEYQENI